METGVFFYRCKKYNVSKLLADKKQGFSVDTINLWKSYGKKFFDYYFDKSRLIESGLINSDWIESNLSRNELNVRYVNKFLGLLDPAVSSSGHCVS